MADVKISGLPASTTPLAGTEVLPIVQGGATKQVSIANVTAGRAIAATSITTDTYKAASSSGGALQNSGGTPQLQWGAGGGNNLSVDVAININPANAAVAISPTGTGTVAISPAGALTINPTAASTINNTSIGVTTAAAGRFSSLTNTALTAGRVSFAGTAGLLSDSANLSWDNANVRLGVGTASPSYKVNAVVTTGADAFFADANAQTFSGYRIRAGASGQEWAFRGGNTTMALTDATASADRLVINTSGNVGINTSAPNRNIEAAYSSGTTLGIANSTQGAGILYGRIAMYSTGFSNAFIDYGGEIRSYSGGGVDSSDLRFYTASAAASAERVRIFNSGGVSIGNTTNPGAGNLSVTGTVRTSGYTVATLPAAGVAGRRAYVTDATLPTYLGALVGGGAVVCPVFDNGTAWVSA
jgi:hypothetical protein